MRNAILEGMATRIGDATRAKIMATFGSLCDHMAAGLEMQSAYDIAGVTADMVRVWRLEDKTGEREKEWQAARQQSADAFADKVAEIADNPGFDGSIARVRMDAYRWLASKRNPHAYSDKAQLDVNVRTVDLTRIIQDANARLAAAQAGRIIEGEALRVALPHLTPELADLM